MRRKGGIDSKGSDVNSVTHTRSGRSIMTNNKLPLVILAVAVLGLAGCNRSGEHAQDNFNSAGHSIGNAATDTGHGIVNGAKATGDAIGSGARSTGNAIDNAVGH
jgi:hypothetical protein